MKRITSLIFVIIFSVQIFGAETTKAVKFEDIPKDHWAYNAINNLVKKGIFKEDAYLFKGDQNVNRYDFAYYLSKTLNKLDEEKASQKDVAVIEVLIANYSQELQKIGFDTKSFDDKINNINLEVGQLKEIIIENQKAIADLKKRVEALE